MPRAKLPYHGGGCGNPHNFSPIALLVSENFPTIMHKDMALAGLSRDCRHADVPRGRAIRDVASPARAILFYSAPPTLCCPNRSRSTTGCSGPWPLATAPDLLRLRLPEGTPAGERSMWTASGNRDLLATASACSAHFPTEITRRVGIAHQKLPLGIWWALPSLLLHRAAELQAAVPARLLDLQQRLDLA